MLFTIEGFDATKNVKTFSLGQQTSEKEDVLKLKEAIK